MPGKPEWLKMKRYSSGFGLCWWC